MQWPTTEIEIQQLADRKLEVLAQHWQEIVGSPMPLPEAHYARHKLIEAGRRMADEQAVRALLAPVEKK